MTTSVPGGIAGTGITALVQVSLHKRNKDAPAPPSATWGVHASKSMFGLPERKFHEHFSSICLPCDAGRHSFKANSYRGPVLECDWQESISHVRHSEVDCLADSIRLADLIATCEQKASDLMSR